MKYISKLLFVLTLLFLALWQLPWAYNFMTQKKSKHSFTLFSPLLKNFISNQVDKAGNLYSTDGENNYSKAETDSLLPFFHYRQLIQDGRFPDAVGTEKITPRSVQRTNFIFRSHPKDINGPNLTLYALLESKSGRVNLEMPTDLFRTTATGITFIDMNSNTIHQKKSEEFTALLKKKGCQFPLSRINGNGTNRKEYDNGYLLVDKQQQLFQLKMVGGHPFVRKIKIPNSIELDALFVTEFRNHSMLAFVTDMQKQLYVITLPDYTLQKIQIPSFNAHSQQLTIIGNLYTWTLHIKDEVGSYYYGINATNYQLYKQRCIPQEKSKMWGIQFTSNIDNYMKIRW